MRRFRFAIPVFPGSNCDHDAAHVIERVLGHRAEIIWHTRRSLRGADVVVVPGGFAHGDYLRCGAFARFSPIMKAVQAHARAGKPVIGICNGFQVLCEAGLLPGVLTRNLSLQFVCCHVHIRVENISTAFTRRCSPGQILRMPVAHGEGRYTLHARDLGRLRQSGGITFRYCNAAGQATPEANPNGAMDNIAGIANARGNVVGLMPHPERASEEVLGSVDGRLLFESVLEHLAAPGWRRGS